MNTGFAEALGDANELLDRAKDALEVAKSRAGAETVAQELLVEAIQYEARVRALRDEIDATRESARRAFEAAGLDPAAHPATLGRWLKDRVL